MEYRHSSFDLHSATHDEAEILNKKLDAFNAKQLSFSGDVEELKNYVIKDRDLIVGGIRICLYFNECMVINLLYIDEGYRGQGLGSWLIKHAEQEAKSKGIRLSHTDTLDFQAKDFYIKHGYEVFGVLNDCPTKGHQRYYLKKLLS